MTENNFKIGDIVTLKSHPLAFQEDGRIDALVNQIPPFMCIKEIHVEKKKVIYSKDSGEKKIADKIKYLCTYFNQHRMIFEDRYVFHSMLCSLQDIKFHNKSEEVEEDHIKLIDETSDYNIASYEFGKRVFFKTYKLEKRKKFNDEIRYNNKSKTKTAVVHTSPAFLLNGFKSNDQKSVYNQKNGTPLKLYSEELFKILWYNSYQEKFSEEFLPKEFFTRDKLIYSS